MGLGKKYCDRKILYPCESVSIRGQKKTNQPRMDTDSHGSNILGGRHYALGHGELQGIDTLAGDAGDFEEL